MPLIKANNAPASLSPFSMRDVEQHAQQLIARAQVKADQLIKAAQAAAAKIQEDAQKTGQAEGQKQGVTQGIEQGKAAGQKQALEENKKALTELHKALTQAVQAWEENSRQLATQGLSEVVQLSLAIARRVTKRQAEIDPKVLEANLDEAMKLVVHGADLRIALNPAQEATLRQAMDRLALTWPALAHAELVADASVSAGGCRVFTASGIVDADIDQQLDRIIAELLPGENPQ
jgi:flagellar assembly protein FliH